MPAITAATLIAAASLGVPEVYELSVDQSASEVSLLAGFSLDAEGELIGDFDEVDNPGGTQTRPGLFGGSGNQPIPISLGASVDTDTMTTPDGSFTFTADVATGDASIDGLTLDLLNGAVPSATLSIALMTQTFRTFSPSFLYPGGIPIELPIGSADITAFSIAQTGGGAGVLVEVGPGEYNLAASIEAEVTFIGEALDNEIAPEPTPITLPIAANVLIGDATAVVTISIEPEDLSMPIDVSGLPALPAIPFELPTLGSDTAGVLLTLTLSNAAIESSGELSIQASGVITQLGCNDADVAAPFGELDIADVVTFLQRFGAMDPSVDLAAPFGAWDIADVVAFLQEFGAGCA